MEKAIINFLNKLYEWTGDFTLMCKVLPAMMIVLTVICIVYEKKRKGINFNE